MFGYRLAGMKPRYFSTGAASLLRQCGRLPGGGPEVPVEDRHVQDDDPDAGQDRRDGGQPGIAAPGAECDAGDGGRGDRAGVAERSQQAWGGADLFLRCLQVQGGLI